MPQLHFYVPDNIEQVIRKKAQSANLSVSRFLANLVKREVLQEDGDWPAGYFERVLGKWEGDLERPPQGELEERTGFDSDSDVSSR